MTANLASFPPIGTYWTEGTLRTSRDLALEAYSTCARCGAFVNSPDRHDDWHRSVEHVYSPQAVDRG